MSPLPVGVLEQFLAPFLAGTSVELLNLRELDQQQADAALAQAEILLGDYSFERPITEALLEKTQRLRLIQQPSVGVQHIDLEACRRKGIPVANAAGANDRSVAEHTLMLALMLLKKAVYFHGKTAHGEWTQHEAFELGVFELSGKRWGIVGMGRIGRELAKRLLPFDVEMLYYDLKPLAPEDESSLGIQFAPFEKLVRKSDIVSLHLPLTPETRHLVSAPVLKSMKPGSYLINVARGELVDEAALAEALNRGSLAGAGLDVFSQEPIDPNNPLIKARNVILTPHLAGTTNEARARIIEVAVKNIVTVLKGGKPVNVVNGDL